MHRHLIALIVAVVARAEVPPVLSFTGTLLDVEGVALADRTRTIEFRLFDVMQGGTALWVEPVSVTTEEGVFTALLGAAAVPLSAEVLAHSPLWLEIEIDQDVLSPRWQLVSVPYAITAGTAEVSASLDCVGCVGAEHVDDTEIQRRVAGSCGGGDAVVEINLDGSVVCAPGIALAGSGVAETGARSDHDHAGTYLPMGASTSCPGAQKVTGIDAASGNVFCADDVDTDTTYSAGVGITIVGTTISSTLAGLACGGQDKLSGFDALGNPICSADARIVGTQLPKANTVTLPDSVGSGGRHTAATVGADGLPVISHHDALGGDLRVLKCGDPSCTGGNVSSIVDAGPAGSVGEYASIALGTDGLPIISYYDAGNGDLRVAHCGDPACTSANTLTTVDGAAEDVGRYTSITVGTDGLPIVSYRDVTNLALKVAKCNAAACDSGALLSTVDTGNVGEHTSIAVGADGMPIISYYDVPNDNLKVAWCGDGACAAGNLVSTVDGGPQDHGRYSSIAIGQDGLPIIAHYCASQASLRVARCDDVPCSGATPYDLDTSADVGSHVSLTIGTDGLPVMAYHDATNGTLKLAKCSRPDCSISGVTTVVDPDAVAGHFASITIGADGMPLIAYRDVTGDRLRVVKCANAFCVPNWSRR